MYKSDFFCNFALQMEVYQKMKKGMLVVLALAMSLQAGAWGQKGHRIVAEIAYHYMTHKAKRSVNQVLGVQHGMVYYANWPDELKSDPVLYHGSSYWHYQDMDSGMSDSVVMAAWVDYPKEGGKLFYTTDSMMSVLRENPGDRDALIFLIHLTGDICCPVHMGHMDDQGGNKVKMKWFGNQTNLHSVWDSSLIESQGYSYTEFAEKLINMYKDSSQVMYTMSLPEMTVRTYHLADAIYAYQKSYNGNNYHYIYHWHEPCEKQLFMAGVKLAALLNELYK